MTLADRVTAPVVRPVFVGFLDIKDDPVYGWTGPGVFAPTGTGDPDLDGNVFTSVEGAVEISDFVENMGSGRPISLTFSAPDNDARIVRQIVRDRRAWQLRRAKLWLFFFSGDQVSVLPEYQQLFSGVIAQAQMSRRPGEAATIIIDLDTDLRGAFSAEARLTDLPRFRPDDKFSSFMVPLASGPIASATYTSGHVYPGRVRGGGGGGFGSNASLV